MEIHFFAFQSLVDFLDPSGSFAVNKGMNLFMAAYMACAILF